MNQCVTQNAALCASPTELTPDQLALIQWIRYNVYLDLAEHGIGSGVFDPFAGTVTVTNGVVTSFTPSSSTPTPGFTPEVPSSPPQALQLSRATPIEIFNSPQNPLPGQGANSFDARTRSHSNTSP